MGTPLAPRDPHAMPREVVRLNTLEISAVRATLARPQHEKEATPREVAAVARTRGKRPAAAKPPSAISGSQR